MRTYVNVFALFDETGRITPRAIIWNDGRRFTIDRIVRVEQKAALRSGGAGLRYHVIISGHERYLYFNDTRWFIESTE